jgi:hypothetical protein
MKVVQVILLSFIVIGFAINVQAANVSFDPNPVTLKVAPGETGRTAVTVKGSSKTSYSLTFLVGSKRENCNIPHGWLTAAYLWLDSKADGTSSASMNLIVSVPPDAKPGTYSGLLLPDDMRSSEAIYSDGVKVSIEVAPPQTASATPPVL